MEYIELIQNLDELKERRFLEPAYGTYDDLAPHPDRGYSLEQIEEWAQNEDPKIPMIEEEIKDVIKELLAIRKEAINIAEQLKSQLSIDRVQREIGFNRAIQLAANVIDSMWNEDTPNDEYRVLSDASSIIRRIIYSHD